MVQRPSPPEELARWTEVDQYYERRLGASDASLEAALKASAEAGLPSIQVSPLQGKLLHLLSQSIRARRILEVGTLGGYSTIWLARSLPAQGLLVTLEIDPHHGEVARENLRQAGVAARVEIRLGPALDSLRALREETAPPFDLIFIDANKDTYPEYYDAALSLSHPGTLIAIDNVVRRGDVVDAESDDPQVQGVRRMNEAIARDPRVSATALQTVGVKGYDGFLLARVNGEP